MALVPQQGLIAYSGVSFPVYTEMTACSIKPEKDAAGRTVTHNHYTLTFKSTITGRSRSEADATARLLRQVLTKNGGVLIVQGRAIGDIFVNTNGVRDVKNGPWPEELSFEPAVGGELVSKLMWRISFDLPECPDAAYIQRALSFTYDSQIQIDDFGYTTRTLNIELIVPQNQTFPGSRYPQDSADSYVERITPPLLPGFRRKYGLRTLSKDRSTVNWSVIDEELKGAIPPAGIVEAHASMTFSCSQVGMVTFLVTLNADYTLAKNGSMDNAINAFLAFAKDKRDEIFKLNQVNNNKATFVPCSFSVTNPDYYGPKKVTFSMGATVVTSLPEIFAKGGGLFKPVPGQNAREWALSMSGSAFNPRGSARLVFSIANDRIVDLCDAGPSPQQNQVVSKGKLIADGLPFDDEQGRELFTKPTPQNSWLQYINRLRWESDAGVVSLRTLPTEPVTQTTDLQNNNTAWDVLQGIFNSKATKPAIDGGVAGGVAGGVGGNKPAPMPPGFPAPGRIENTAVETAASGVVYAVRRTRPQSFIIMEGFAIRAGFQIEEPALLTVNGVKVLDVSDAKRGEMFIQKPHFVSPNNVVWYKAVWRKRYALTDTMKDTNLPDLPNPIYPNGKGQGQ